MTTYQAPARGHPQQPERTRAWTWAAWRGGDQLASGIAPTMSPAQQEVQRRMPPATSGAVQDPSGRVWDCRRKDGKFTWALREPARTSPSPG